MSKGQEQAADVAARCRELAASLSSTAGTTEDGALSGRLEKLAGRLDGLQHRLFLRMGASVPFTTACLEATVEVRLSLDAGAPAADLPAGVEALEAAVKTLEAKCLSAGGMIIT